jgi:hypothetical protein
VVRPPTARRERVALLLIGYGEPASYTGPKPWAAWLAKVEARGERVPHWFLRPRAYARARSVYAQMGAGHLARAMQSLAEDLAQQLDGDSTSAVPGAIESTIWTTKDDLDRRLIHLANDGYNTIMLLPLNPRRDDLLALNEVAMHSKTRDIGVHVEALDPPADGWPTADPDARMRRIIAGQPVSAPPAPPEAVREAAYGAIGDVAIP